MLARRKPGEGTVVEVSISAGEETFTAAGAGTVSLVGTSSPPAASIVFGASHGRTALDVRRSLIVTSGTSFGTSGPALEGRTAKGRTGAVGARSPSALAASRSRTTCRSLTTATYLLVLASEIGLGTRVSGPFVVTARTVFITTVVANSPIQIKERVGT